MPVEPPRPPSAWPPPHDSEVVISDAARAVYIVNLKAASSSIGLWLERHAQAQLSCTFNSTWHLNASCCWFTRGIGKLTTRCLNERHRDYFVFSFVRSPKTKFEAGVRQMWVQNPVLRKYSSSQMLHWMLDHPLSRVRDEHLQTSLWALSAQSATAGVPVRLDFVGRVEKFDADWKALLRRWPPLNELALKAYNQSGRRAIAPAHDNARIRNTSYDTKPCKHNLYDHTMSCQAYQEKHHGSTLSADDLCAMCSSWRFGWDFVRYNYSSQCGSGGNCSTSSSPSKSSTTTMSEL